MNTILLILVRVTVLYLLVIPCFPINGQRLVTGIKPFNPTSIQSDIAPHVCTEMLSGDFQAAGARNYFWNKSELHVRFLNGDSYVQEKVKQYASIWSQYASIRFDFVAAGNAEIRISFKRRFVYQGQEKTDVGSWSLIGTDSLRQTDQNLPTMNFGWLDQGTTEEEFSRVVLHEFGHALGMIHEHQSPAANIPWNKSAVYSFYINNLGWDKSTVDHNIFEHYNARETQFTRYDSTSIMHYAVPAELLEPGATPVRWNANLSENDKFFISSKYPAVTLSLQRLSDSGETLIEPNEIPLKFKTDARFNISFVAPFQTYLYVIGYSADGSYLTHPLSLDQADARIGPAGPLNLKFRVSGQPGDEGIILIFSPSKLESADLNRRLSAAAGNFNETALRLKSLRQSLPDTDSVGIITSLSCDYISEWMSDVFGLPCANFEETNVASRSGFGFAVGSGTGKPFILRVAYIHE